MVLQIKTIFLSGLLLLTYCAIAQASTVGTQAPDFKLKDTTGKERSLSEFKGQYVLIDFWGTWCGPCIKEIPYIKAAYNKIDKEKIEFISMCVECSDDATITEFANKNDMTWVNIHDEEGEIADAFAVEGYPTVFIIGPDGKIVARGGTGETDGPNKEAGFHKDEMLPTIQSYIK